MTMLLRVEDQQEGRTRWIPFVGPEMTLGRETNNDLVLLRSTVAKKHCKIAYLDNKYAYQQLYRPVDGFAHDAPLRSASWFPMLPRLPGSLEGEAPLQVGDFAIVLERWEQDAGKALSEVQSFLLDDSEYSASQRLEAALSHAPLPSHLLHHFATDCAARSLLREECAGREPSSRCWEGIHVKRRWIEGKATERERAIAQMSVEKQIFYFFEEELFTDAYATYASAAAVAAASMPEAVFAVESNAANWAADAAGAAATAKERKRSHPPRHMLETIWQQARNDECQWQCRRLAQLIEELQRSQYALISLLCQRNAHLYRSLNLWRETLEQALF